MAEDMVWLFDSLTGFLKGPEWCAQLADRLRCPESVLTRRTMPGTRVSRAVPVWDYIDDNCIIFDSEEENKLAYQEVFNNFRELVESLLGMHLAEMGCEMEQFAELCQAYGTTEVGKEVIEQICAVDDFVSFKKMMVKRNMELELETMRALSALENGETPPAAEAEEGEDVDEEEAEMRHALALSLQEAEAAGLSTHIHAAEIADKEAEQEDADLQQALAMSLQLEEERCESPLELPPSMTFHGLPRPSITLYN